MLIRECIKYFEVPMKCHKVTLRFATDFFALQYVHSYSNRYVYSIPQSMYLLYIVQPKNSRAILLICTKCTKTQVNSRF